MNEIKDFIDSSLIASTFKTRFDQIQAMMIDKEKKKELVNDLIKNIREVVIKRFPEKYDKISSELDKMESELKKI